jgi:hypothetical protein
MLTNQHFVPASSLFLRLCNADVVVGHSYTAVEGQNQAEESERGLEKKPQARMVLHNDERRSRWAAADGGGDDVTRECERGPWVHRMHRCQATMMMREW